MAEREPRGQRTRQEEYGRLARVHLFTSPFSDAQADYTGGDVMMDFHSGAIRFRG